VIQLSRFLLSNGVLIGWLALASGALAEPVPAPAAALPGTADTRSEGTERCKVEKPAAWTSGGVSWLGSCRAGFAHGYGVILSAGEGSEGERFFGRVDHGYLRVGVVQTGSGFMAGNWIDGVLAEPLLDDVAQRNLLIGAFEAGAKAAGSVSKLLAKKADARSSRFYAEQARRLRAQMD
jgi:hypothetical protein